MRTPARKNAIAEGLPTYATGEPCKWGHIALRHTRNGECTECEAVRLERTREARLAGNRRRYLRDHDERLRKNAEWRAANPDRVLEYRGEYYAKNAERLRVKARKYCAENKTESAARSKRYAQKNRQALRDYKKRYREENKEKLSAEGALRRKNDGPAIRAYLKEYGPIYRAANKDKVNFWAAKRRCAKLLRTPTWLTEGDWCKIRAIYEDARELSEITGIEMHVDHDIPLQGATVSGLHVPWNLRVLVGTDNMRKGNRA